MVGSYAQRTSRSRRTLPAKEVVDSRQSEDSVEPSSGLNFCKLQSPVKKHWEFKKISIINCQSANKISLNDDNKSENEESSFCDQSNQDNSGLKKEQCVLDPMWKYYPKQVQNICIL